jgi:hypothetical protein
MEKFISFVVACILAAGVSYAAGNKSEPVKQPVVTSQSAAPVVAAETGEHDYKLERESCCGPQ